jgi:hypothetical protein
MLPLAGATFAVNVTDPPYVDGLSDDVTAVVVATLDAFTTIVPLTDVGFAPFWQFARGVAVAVNP